MAIELTDEQEELIRRAVAWFRRGTEPIFIYSGKPGTGKSFVMHDIIRRIGLSENQVAPMSYTGCSALIMRRNGFTNAKTIHSWIYNFNFEYDHVTKQIKSGFYFNGVPADIRLICIDECSMVNTALLNDLLKCNIPILACGDAHQLKPISGDSPFFDDPDRIFYLTKIMRQAEGSAIVQISNMVYEDQTPSPGSYGKRGEVYVVERNDFYNNMPMYIREYGLVLCGTNKMRESLNHRIRKDIFGYESPLPSKGEKIICRKNSFMQQVDDIPLVNGLYGEAMNTPSISSFSGGEKGYFILDFRPEFMKHSFRSLEVDYLYFTADPELRMKLKKNFNLYERFEFAYSLTVHVAQGSQYNQGIYMQEFFPTDSNKLHYTAITRFREKALYVIPNQKKKWAGFGNGYRRNNNYHYGNYRSGKFHKQYHNCDRLLPVPLVDGSLVR